MTPLEVATNVRFLTGTDSTTFTDDQMEALLKEYLPNLASMVNERSKNGEDILGVYAYRDLEADKREYALPSTVRRKIKTVEAILDSNTMEQVRLKEFDLNMYSRTTDESTITSVFASNPMFDLYRGSIWIYSDTITNTEEGNNGLILWYLGEFKTIDDMSEDSIDMSTPPTTGDESYKRGIPVELHPTIVTYLCMQYKMAGDRQLAFTQREANYEIDLERALDRLENINLDRVVDLSPPKLSGNFGAGYDL